MLKEIFQQRSDAIHKNRRWFQDPEMGLFVWTNENQLIERFQLIYFIHGSEQTLQWSHEDGLKNYHTETHRYQSAILSSETQVDISALRDSFFAVSEEIDPDVRNFVVSRLTTNSLDGEEPDGLPLPATSSAELLYLILLIFLIGIGFITLLTTAK